MTQNRKTTLDHVSFLLHKPQSLRNGHLGDKGTTQLTFREPLLSRRAGPGWRRAGGGAKKGDRDGASSWGATPAGHHPAHHPSTPARDGGGLAPGRPETNRNLSAAVSRPRCVPRPSAPRPSLVFGAAWGLVRPISCTGTEDHQQAVFINPPAGPTDLTMGRVT